MAVVDQNGKVVETSPGLRAHRDAASFTVKIGEQNAATARLKAAGDYVRDRSFYYDS